MAETEKQRREKQAANAVNQYSETLGNKLPKPTDPNTNATATKLATTFNTNRMP